MATELRVKHRHTLEEPLVAVTGEEVAAVEDLKNAIHASNLLPKITAAVVARHP